MTSVHTVTGKRQTGKQLFRELRWELPFWLCLCYWSLLPSIKSPVFMFLDMPLKSKDLLLILLAAFYGVSSLATRRFRFYHTQWNARFPAYFVFFLAYAAVSLSWSGLEGIELIAMAYTLVLLGAAFLVGYILIACRYAEEIPAFLTRLVTYLSAVGLLYFAESFFDLGLRSVQFNSDFGMQRVRGPLWGSSNGFFLLMPALAFAFGEGLKGDTKRIHNFCIASFLMLAFLGLGSRVGIGMLALYAVLVPVCMKGRKAWFQSLLVIFLLAIIGAVVFSHSEVRLDRLTTLEEEGRRLTHEAAWEAVKTRPIGETLLGSGYGSFWNWYLTDVEEIVHLGAEGNLKVGSYGVMLYHPHSLFLMLGIEVGLIGLWIFVKLGMSWIYFVVQGLKGNPFGLFAVGVGISGIGAFFDYLLENTFIMGVLWWIFFFASLALCRRHEVHRYVVAPVPREYRTVVRLA